MKRISVWARHNQFQARIVIIISWILLTLIGIYIGITLKEMNSIMPKSILAISIIGYLIIFLIYPFKGQRKTKTIISFYVWQKTCDMVVAVASFLIVICVANNPKILFSGYQIAFAVNMEKMLTPSDSIHTTYKSIKEFSLAMKGKDGRLLSWKERKKLLKTQVHEIRKADGISKNNKGLLIFLSVIVALGLLVLLGAAACSLSCNGSDAAAAIVGIGGTIVLVWLLILVIRKINGKSKKKKIDKDSPTPSG